MGIIINNTLLHRNIVKKSLHVCETLSPATVMSTRDKIMRKLIILYSVQSLNVAINKGWGYTLND